MSLFANSVTQFFIAAAATICFGILFSVPKRHFWACGLTGAVGWLVYLLSSAAGLSPAMATFAAALPLTLLARTFSVRNRAPVTLFLLCGIFPLVPGAGIYYTAYYFLQNDRLLFVNKGVETFKIAIAIALGIALISSLPFPTRRGATARKGKTQ